MFSGMKKLFNFKIKIEKMRKKISKILLAICFLVIAPAIASADQGETVNCFDYYKFQSVQVNVGPDKSVYMSGEKVRFSGELTNENSYPIVDGYVFVRVSRNNSNYRADWHDVVDEFVAPEKITLDARAEKKISFDWSVPDVASGDYRTDFFFSVGKKYNLGGLPFSNEVTIGSSEFQVVTDSEEAVSLVRSETKVNGQKYAHIGNWPNINTGEKAEIAQPLKNSFKTEKKVNVTYDLYWWDSLDEKDKITSKNEKISVPAGGTANLSYLVPEMKDSVYMLKITAQAGDQKSIVNVRLTSKQEHPRLNYPGLTKFPLQKGGQADLFTCFHNTSSLDTKGTIKIVLEDAKGNKVDQLDYDGPITGSMMAVKKNLTAPQEYSWLKMIATLSDSQGKTLETYEAVYDCALLDSAECKNALAEQSRKDDSAKKTKTLFIGIVALLTVLSLVIIIVKRKRQALSMIFFFLLACGMFVGANTSQAAVPYSYPEQSPRSISSAVMGFTGDSDGHACESLSRFPKSQFPKLYCDNDYCPCADKYTGTDKVFGNVENDDGVCDVTSAWKLDSKQLTIIHKMAISDSTKPLGTNENGAILLDPKSESLEFVYVSDDPTYTASGEVWDTPNGNWCEGNLNCGPWLQEDQDGGNDNVLYGRFNVKDPTNFVRFISSDNSVIGCNGVAGNLRCAVKGPGAATITAEIPDTASRMYARITEDGDDKCAAYKGLTFEAANLTWKVRVVPPDDLAEKIKIRLVERSRDADGNITTFDIDYDSPPSEAITYRINGVARTTGAVNGQSPVVEADVVAQSLTVPFRVAAPKIDQYAFIKTKFNCNGVITENMGNLKDGGNCTAIVYYSKNVEIGQPPVATIDAPLQGQEFTLTATVASAPDSSVFAKLWNFLKTRIVSAAQSVATVTFRGHGTDNDAGDRIVAHRWYDSSSCIDADGNFIAGCIGDLIHEEEGVGVTGQSTFTKNYTQPGNYRVYYQVESQHFDGNGNRVGQSQFFATEVSNTDQVNFKIKDIPDIDKCQLTVTTVGSGSVNIAPPGVNCKTPSSSCNQAYNKDTAVRLTAEPSNIYWIFKGWSGACSGEDKNCDLIMSGSPCDKSVTATFERPCVPDCSDDVNRCEGIEFPDPDGCCASMHIDNPAVDPNCCTGKKDCSTPGRGQWQEVAP